MFCTTKSAIVAFSMLTLGFSSPSTSSPTPDPVQETVTPVTATVASLIDAHRLIASAQPAGMPIVKPTLALGVPAPQSPLVLQGDSPTLEDVIHAFEASVQAIVLKDDDVCAQVANKRLRLGADLVVPQAEVYSFFESLLVQSGYCLSFLKGGAVPLLAVRSIRDHGDPGHRFIQVSPSDLPSLDEHPALLVSVTLDLANADGRQLSNALRNATSGGPNMVLAVGERTVTVRGTAANVALLGRIVQQTDAATVAEVEQPKGGPTGK